MGKTKKKHRNTPARNKPSENGRYFCDVSAFVPIQPGGDERPDLVEDPRAGQHQARDQADHEEDGQRFERRERDQGSGRSEPCIPEMTSIMPASKNCIGRLSVVPLRDSGSGSSSFGAIFRELGDKPSASTTA